MSYNTTVKDRKEPKVAENISLLRFVAGYTQAFLNLILYLRKLGILIKCH